MSLTRWDPFRELEEVSMRLCVSGERKATARSKSIDVKVS
jgi:hypothetical protein